MGYSNKCLRVAFGDVVEEWVLPLDAMALAPIRGASGFGMAIDEQGNLAGDRAQSLDMLHLLVLLTCCVYRYAVRSCGLTDETRDPKLTTLHSLVSALGVEAPSAALQHAAE